MSSLFEGHHLALQYLVPNLLQLYVDIEFTGAHNQVSLSDICYTLVLLFFCLTLFCCKMEGIVRVLYMFIWPFFMRGCFLHLLVYAVLRKIQYSSQHCGAAGLLVECT
jgi:hypothetical protein